MCGIAGCFHPGEFLEADAQAILKGLQHRGPDGNGHWRAEESPIHLFHCRLSILDLSELASQPMSSQSGKTTMVFNGEIYNFKELKKDLEGSGVSFRGTGDSEVLIEAIERWGLNRTLERCNGMFALAVWDKERKCLLIARDRLGIKPFYYGWSKGAFWLSSELAPLIKTRKVSTEISQDALELYFRHNYVPAPLSILKDIYKLPAGTTLQLSESDLESKPRNFCPWESPEAFWNLVTEANEERSLEETVELCHEKLKESVKRRMISDVPLGALLSGGIDSSTVVALMQSMSDKPIKTFTIGFHEGEFNEAQYAKEIAEHLGTDHHELYLEPKDSLDLIPNLPQMFSEPFADSSQLPTYLVCQLARKEVTVALSGDGGDELFFGYSRYPAVQRIWKKLALLPKAGRGLMGSVLAGIPEPALRAMSPLQSLLPADLRVSNFERRVKQLAAAMRVDTPQELYSRAITHWHEAFELIGRAQPLESEVEKLFKRHSKLSFEEQMMLIDLYSYLPDDILTKVDRTSMACSLEARVPILDHELVELAWTIPLKQRFAKGQTKYPLREILASYLPRELFERKKMGFGVPIKHWLRGELRNWAENLLNPKRLQSQSLLNEGMITKLWQDHLSGRNDHSYLLWDVLMFQAWAEYYEISI